MTDDTQPHPKRPSYDWIADDNVANHLFRLDSGILDKPGVIVARWDDEGKLLEEEVLTFAKLQEQVLKCMVYLHKRGLKKGDRVLLMVRMGLELIVICFALFRLGMVPIVIDPGMGLGKFRRAVKHSKPDVLVGIPASIWISRVFRSSFRSLRLKVAIEKEKFFRAIRDCDSETKLPIEPTHRHDLAAILFTSGSTGAPKGVCYEQGMFDAQIRLLKAYFRIQPGEIDLPILPVFALFNPAMGMTTVIPEINPSRPATVNPAKIVAAIERYRVTNSFGSPVIWRKIGDYCEARDLKFPTLRRILVAGAAAPTQLYRQFEPLLVNGMMHSPYGATECLPVSAISGHEVLGGTAAMTDCGKGICVGKPFEEVKVRIIRVETEGGIRELPRGTVGEILVNGPSVTQAYDGLPEMNARTKIVDQAGIWHRMGDTGYLDEEGRLWFCGRVVERVIAGENTFYTECVEGLFLSHPRVRRCAMIEWTGSKPTSSVNHLALVVEPEKKAWPSTKESKEWFARELVRYLKEKELANPLNAFFFQKRLPVDVRHNAKIHRLSLRRQYQTRQPVIVT